jgi:PAS domain-containing protein
MSEAFAFHLSILYKHEASSAAGPATAGAGLTDATARERLDEILQRAAVGIAQMDTTGRYVLVNDRYCDMLGRTRPERAGDHDGADTILEA